MQEDAKALLGRKWIGGTRVTNCVAHYGTPLDQRPDDCKLCLTDLRNQFQHALSVNDWLNEWKTDAEKVLAEVIKA